MSELKHMMKTTMLLNKQLSMMEKCKECEGLFPLKSEYQCDKCEESFCSDCIRIRCVGSSVYQKVLCKSCDG